MVEAVSLSMATEILPPAASALVIVGDAAALEADVREAGFDVTVVPVDAPHD